MISLPKSIHGSFGRLGQPACPMHSFVSDVYLARDANNTFHCCVDNATSIINYYIVGAEEERGETSTFVYDELHGRGIAKHFRQRCLVLYPQVDSG